MASQSLADWSKQRLSMVTWEKTETYYSRIGIVTLTGNGEWTAKVQVGNKLYRLAETFASAESAKGAVERTWEREKGKQNETKL